MKKLLLLLVVLFLILTFVNIYAETDESLYPETANFKILLVESYSENGDKLSFDPPVQLFEVKYERVRLTMLQKTIKDGEEFITPVFEEEKLVFIEPSDEGYLDSIKLLASNNLVSYVSSKEQISKVLLSIKNNASYRGIYSTISKVFYVDLDDLRTLNTYHFELYPEHKLHGLSPGALLIYDSNLNFNVYDVPTGEFELIDSGCINPDVIGKEKIHDVFPEHIALLHHMYMNNKNIGDGYIELFKDNNQIIKDGVNGDISWDYDEKGYIFTEHEKIPASPLFPLSMLLDIRMDFDVENRAITIYRLLDRPKDDVFYVTLEMKIGEKTAKLSIADDETEFELSFAPFEDENSTSGQTIVPVLDVLDALRITYRYPRANGSILINHFREY